MTSACFLSLNISEDFISLTEGTWITLRKACPYQLIDLTTFCNFSAEEYSPPRLAQEDIWHEYRGLVPS